MDETACPSCRRFYPSAAGRCPFCAGPAASFSGGADADARGDPSRAAVFSPDAAFDPARRAPSDSPTLRLSGPLRPVSPSASFREGDLISNKYRLLNRLGRGGFGEVHKALDVHASTPGRDIYVAVKLLPPEIASHPDEIAGLLQCFQQARGLHHPNIAAHLAWERDGDRCALILEYVEGATLAGHKRLREEAHGRFPPSEAMAICRQAAEGLDFSHSRRVAHRDFKPENVMITPEGGVKILDFGLSAEIRLTLSRVSGEIHPIAGTRPYMAPEQWLGRPPGPGADQYALAIVLYELVCGRPPFVSSDTEVLRACALGEAPRPLEALTPWQNQCLLRALAKEAGDRFPSCGDFMRALAD